MRNPLARSGGCPRMVIGWEAIGCGVFFSSVFPSFESLIESYLSGLFL